MLMLSSMKYEEYIIAVREHNSVYVYMLIFRHKLGMTITINFPYIEIHKSKSKSHFLIFAKGNKLD